jgi:excisionase family DNA binding protein
MASSYRLPYGLNRRLSIMKTPLMNVRDFAEALGVTTACIRRWILERRIASVKIGRLVKLPESEVQRIIDSGWRGRKGHGDENHQEKHA